MDFVRTGTLQTVVLNCHNDTSEQMGQCMHLAPLVQTVITIRFAVADVHPTLRVDSQGTSDQSLISTED